MADSAVVVTAGTGTNIDTRTEGTNGHHRQVVVLGDPATNAGVAPVDATAGLKVDLGADNDVVVSATDLDIRDLAKASDSVTAAIENIHEANFDSGAGTDTTPAIGIAVPASGGAAVITGDTTNGLDVDVTRSALPSGASTSAKQDTIIGHLDGVETVLGTIDTDTGNISTKIDTIAGAVSGTEMQVDVLTMPTVAVTQSGTWDEVGINDSGNSITIDVNGTAVSSTNPLLIGAMAIQDTGNSTTATLGSGGNFTGTAFDLNSYSSWSINIFSDKASSSNGLVVQWSDDGTNWDFSDAITYVASVGNMITFGRKARYVRLNYTNTNSAQTVFRVTAYAQPLSVRQTRKFVGSALSDGETGQVVIAGIQGHTTAGGGAWVDVKVSPSGSLSANVSGSTLGANSGVDIGDVTINNASGASAVNIQDGGNTITVDGTVTANLAAGTNNIGDVDILSIAAGDNNIGNVDVVTLPSLPAGTNAIGKLAANSGVDIGDVTLTAGTAAIGTLLPPDIDVTTHTNYKKFYYTNAGAVTDGIVWSPAAGKRWHILWMVVNVSADATVTFEDDKAGGDEVVMKAEIAGKSGFPVTCPEKYPLASGEDAADLLITTSAGNVYVFGCGYEI